VEAAAAAAAAAVVEAATMVMVATAAMMVMAAITDTIWWGFVLSSPCHYETQKVRIKFYDRWGNPHVKWVWRDVKVCY